MFFFDRVSRSRTLSPCALGMVAAAAAAMISLSATQLAKADPLGGTVVPSDGKLVLRDLVDPSNCYWQEGSDFAARVSYFKSIREAIANSHWYLAYSLEKEANAVKICLTQAGLKPVRAEDENSVTISSNLEGLQVAVRVGDRVFIDEKLFDKLSDEDQGFVLLHEVSHAYLPIGTPQRNSKLRSFVSVIKRHTSKPLTEKDLALQIRMNSLEILDQMPTDPEARKALVTVLSSQAPYEELLAAANRVSYLVEKLRPSDQLIVTSRVKNYDYHQAEKAEKLNEEFIKAVLAGKADEAAKLIERGADPQTKVLSKVIGEWDFDEDDRSIRRMLKVPAIIRAAEDGNASLIRVLAKRVSVNTRAGVLTRARIEGCKDTALIPAIWGGHVEAVRTLLELGADPNVRVYCEAPYEEKIEGNNYRRTYDGSALSAAVFKGNTRIVKLLLQSKDLVLSGGAVHEDGEVLAPSNTADLMESAVLSGNTELVSLLANWPGVSLNGQISASNSCRSASYNDPMSLMEWAASSNNAPMTRVLISAAKSGWDPCDYKQAMYYAKKCRHREMYDLLKAAARTAGKCTRF